MMLAEAASAHPCECCGVLMGNGDRVARLIPARNVHPDPQSHFEIDPQVLIDTHRAARHATDWKEQGSGWRIMGYYHSHPNGLARPSATDCKMAAYDGLIWAIITAEGVSFWRAGAGGFTTLPYVIADS